MRRALRGLDYGNADTGGGIDRFWLDGELRISPVEQVLFLERLREGHLDADPAVLETVRDLMIERESADLVLRAKTGWASLPGTDIGWYVGWVERGARVVYFALNADAETAEARSARRAIVFDALRAEGLIDERN